MTEVTQAARQGLHWRRKPLLGAIFSCVFIMLLATVSSFGTLLIAHNQFDYPILNPAFRGIPTAVVWLSVAAISSFVTLFVLWMYRNLDDIFDVVAHLHFRPGSRLKDFVSIILLLGAVALLPVLNIAFSFDTTYGDGHMKWYESAVRAFFSFIQAQGGGTLGFGISVLSVVAFLILIQQLKDIQNSVSTFTEMVDKVFELSKECTGENPLHIVSYTPAIGYLALHETYQKKILAMLKACDGEVSKVKMIVLGQEQLSIWHNEFKGRTTRIGKIDDARIAEAEGASTRIRTFLRENDMTNVYGEVDRDAMPGYYCFFSNRRAVIVTPMFLPIRGQLDGDRQNLPSPSMVGFETSDRTTIDHLHQQFEYLSRSAKWH